MVYSRAGTVLDAAREQTSLRQERGLRADDPNRVAKSFVNEHAALFGHDASALERAAVKRDYVAAHNGMRTTVWHQEHEGIEVFEAVFLAHTTKDGELVNVASQFVPDAAQAAGNGDPIFAAAGIIAPAISAADALFIASTHLGDEEALAANISAITVSPRSAPVPTCFSILR